MVERLPGLRVGALCKLELTGPDGNVDTQASRIEELSAGGPDLLAIIWPTRQGQLLRASIGDQIGLVVQTPDAEGRPGATLYLDTEIARRHTPTTADPIPVLVLRVTQVGREQQRHSYRLPLSLEPVDCVFWERPFGMPAEAGNWRPVISTMVDLSMGGAAVVSHQPVDVGTRVRLRFPCPMGGGEIALTGEVRATAAVSEGRTRLSIQFRDTTPVQRELLARCVHRAQVEERHQRVRAQEALAVPA